MKYDPGCYGDGFLGDDHCCKKLFDIAKAEGWYDKLEPNEKAFLFDFPPQDYSEYTEEDLDMHSLYIESLVQNAIDYLNEHCSEEGFLWGFEDGDFGYWEQWE